MRIRPGLTLLVVPLLAACALGSPGATPTPSKAKPVVTCSHGDAAEVDQTLGWAFCYPGTWHFNEKYQSTDAPKGVDATFDITDFIPGPDNGKFGFMIISTDDRGQATSLADWVSANVGPQVQLRPITWSNAVEAAQEVGGGRRFALTAHEVVVMELRSGAGNLDLDTAMAARLDTWKFLY